MPLAWSLKLCSASWAEEADSLLYSCNVCCLICACAFSHCLITHRQLGHGHRGARYSHVSRCVFIRVYVNKHKVSQSVNCDCRSFKTEHCTGQAVWRLAISGCGAMTWTQPTRADSEVLGSCAAPALVLHEGAIEALHLLLQLRQLPPQLCQPAHGVSVCCCTGYELMVRAAASKSYCYSVHTAVSHYLAMKCNSR